MIRIFHNTYSKLLLSSCIILQLAFYANAHKTTQYSPKLSANTVSYINRTSSNATNVPAYIKLHAGADIQRIESEYCVTFNVKAGMLYTALVPQTSLSALAEDKDVERIDVGGETKPMMDSVLILTNVDKVSAGQDLQSHYQGDGVIVGIVDSGFDFLHPNFLDSDGNSRIKCVWDQNSNSGTIPAYGYGSVYNSSEDILRAKHDASYDTHGTHVLGIASGSYNGNKYSGIAPKCDIVVVSTNKSEQGLLDGIDFLLKYSTEQKKPISINVSLGNVLGYKDGTGNFTAMLDEMLKGRKGQILNIATGNEGHRNSVIFGTSDIKSILHTPSYGRDNIFMHGEAGHKYSITISLKNKQSGAIIVEKTLNSETEETASITDFGSASSNSSLVVSSQKNSSTNAPSFSLNILHTLAANEEWDISVSTDGGKFFMGCDYGSFAADDKTGYINGTTDMTIAATATGEQSIAVGAYVSRTIYTDLNNNEHNTGFHKNVIYERSGKGPTFDDRIKPDVVAPGAAVISSFNSYAASYSISNSDKVLQVENNGRNYLWGVSSGTSMATPAVTGIIALWLQAYPELDQATAKEVIKASAIKDEFTGNEPNSIYGYGKIDALAGIKYILKNVGVEEISKPAYQLIDNIFILPETDVIEVYSISGIKVAQAFSKSISLQSIPAGMYIIHTLSACYKIIIK